MDKKKAMDEHAKAPQNRSNNFRPDDGREAGDIAPEESNEERSRASSSGEMASASAKTARIEDNNVNSKAADISADNQTMGIP